MKPCCSQICNTLITLKDRFNVKKDVYNCLGNFISLHKSNSLGMVKSNSVESNKSYPTNSSVGNLIWDASKAGGGITITQNGVQCFLKEQAYLFRTTITTQGFTSGVHYWEILADNRT